MIWFSEKTSFKQKISTTVNQKKFKISLKEKFIKFFQEFERVSVRMYL